MPLACWPNFRCVVLLDLVVLLLWCLVGHHHLDELLVVDLAVAVNVSLADHLVNLLVGQLLADGGHNMAQLSSGDEAVVVAVEHLE